MSILSPELSQYRPQSPKPDSPPTTPPLSDHAKPREMYESYDTPYFPSRPTLSGGLGLGMEDSPDSVSGPELVTPNMSTLDSAAEGTLEPHLATGSGESSRRSSYGSPILPYTMPDKRPEGLIVDPTRWSSSHLDTSSSGSRSRSTSPLPIPSLDTSNSQFAASSSSTHYSLQNPHYKPALSPTLRATFAHQDTPDGYAPQSNPAESRKESFMRSVGLGITEPLEKVWHNQDGYARSRNGYSSGTPHKVPGFNRIYRPVASLSVGDKSKEPFTESVTYWLGLYFAFNLGLTLFNKIVLVSFPFPYTLTGLHALSGCAGCYIALERGTFASPLPSAEAQADGKTPAHLTSRENLILCAFSVLYTINIAVSNISLQLVTVPFHQVVRASTPLFTILIAAVLLRTRFTWLKLVSLLPVVAGVGFATYGDYYFTAWGLILTLLGTFLAALKTVVTNLIQTGGGGRLKLHPMDLLMRMSPLAFIQCVAYGWYTGELERVRTYGATEMTRGKALALLFNGVIACGLNIVSFTANKKAGALTMTVSANCKQVITILLAVLLFDLSISFTNGIGIVLTLVGGAWYGYVEYQEKKKQTKVGAGSKPRN